MTATVVLARLLAPEDFGLVAMVTTFSLLLQNVGFNGFTEAILQREEIDHALVSNLFWVNAGLSLCLAIGFVGYEVVSKVPTMLHTPLMSGANAVHGVIVVGALLVAATADEPLRIVLALVAVLLGTINVVGGFVVTDRMLEMFRRRPGDRP